MQDKILQSHEPASLEEQEILEVVGTITGLNANNHMAGVSVVMNVKQRMAIVGARNLNQYLSFVSQNDAEYKVFISIITIHTTSWFREMPHFKKMGEFIREKVRNEETRYFKILSLACSTGEEVYSIALYLESLRTVIGDFDYSIAGYDIDGVSLQKARKAVYKKEAMDKIPGECHHNLLLGRNKLQGLFTIKKEIREKCSFNLGNMMAMDKYVVDSYDIIFCRNVLIYFSEEDRKNIVKKIFKKLDPKGLVCLGHSENIIPEKFNAIGLGHSTYMKDEKSANEQQPERVLLIDDEHDTCDLFSELLTDNDFHVHVCHSAVKADTFLEKNEVDIIVTDNYMPGENGTQWLSRFRKRGNKIPVVVISSAFDTEILKSLEKDAQECIEKTDFTDRIERHCQSMRQMIQSYKQQKNILSKLPKHQVAQEIPRANKPDLIVIGASTGGTEALIGLLHAIGNPCPPILVTQHIAKEYLLPFGKRLASTACLDFGQGNNGAPILENHIYIAHDDFHICVKERDGKLFLNRSYGEPISGHRPSVDYLFQTAAKLKRKRVLAIILTGMGSDGAKGMLELKQSGAFTAAQNEASCVVFGMPKEAIALGGVNFIGNIKELRALLMNAIGRSDKSHFQAQISA